MSYDINRISLNHVAYKKGEITDIYKHINKPVWYHDRPFLAKMDKNNVILKRAEKVNSDFDGINIDPFIEYISITPNTNFIYEAIPTNDLSLHNPLTTVMNLELSPLGQRILSLFDREWISNGHDPFILFKNYKYNITVHYNNDIIKLFLNNKLALCSKSPKMIIYFIANEIFKPFNLTRINGHWKNEQITYANLTRKNLENICNKLFDNTPIHDLTVNDDSFHIINKELTLRSSFAGSYSTHFDLNQIFEPARIPLKSASDIHLAYI